MENEKIRVEASLLLEKINSRGGNVFKDEKRRLVELRNALCEGKVTYNVGCISCIKKSFTHLTNYFISNPIKKTKIVNKAEEPKAEEPKAEEVKKEEPKASKKKATKKGASKK